MYITWRVKSVYQGTVLTALSRETKNILQTRIQKMPPKKGGGHTRQLLAPQERQLHRAPNHGG
jgi:hypothetical protein